MSLPAEYQDASWRCTLPNDYVRGRVGIAFDVPGQTLRLALDFRSATHVFETLRHYFEVMPASTVATLTAEEVAAIYADETPGGGRIEVLPAEAVACCGEFAACQRACIPRERQRADHAISLLRRMVKADSAVERALIAFEAGPRLL